MTRRLLLGLVLASGCGTDGTGSPVDPPIDPPAEATPIERCLAGGGTFQQLWATSNQHGPVSSIAVGGSIVVLGSLDGSVKQWTTGGASPSYGVPFEDDTGIVVDALAFAHGEHDEVAGVDRDGRFTEWRVSDASPMRTVPVITDGALTAVAISSRQAAIARGPESPEVRVIDRASGDVSPPLTTALWGATSMAFAGEALFTAGHWYGVPEIERRSTESPDAVIEEWRESSLQGHVRAIAVDGVHLAAAGDSFVAILDPGAIAGDKTIVPVEGHAAVGVALLTDMVATAGREGSLRLWTTAGEPVATLTIPEPVGIARDAAGTTLFTSGPDGLLHAFGCK
ncbi:MAG: WD40 repeat domain-containing protein [Kofleriaceae bacterium]